jgi:hypothetical protein
MQQFQLEAVTECECSHVNIREENHGEDKVLAVDLAFWKEGGNELLDLFHPEIRTTLYCNRAAQEGQEALPEVLAVLPNLRLSGPPERMHWGGNDKFAGYRLAVDYGLGDDQSNVDLTECVLAKRWFELKEGGTVRIGWRVSYAGEALQDVTTRGILAGLKGQKAFVQLIPPPVLQLVKGKSGGKVSPGVDDGGGDLLAGGDDDADVDADAENEDEDEDTPEKALERAAAGG